MNNKLKHILFLLLAFYVTFPFVLEKQHLVQDIIFLAGCILGIVINYKILLNQTNFFSPANIMLILFVVLLSVCSLAYPILLGTNDFSYFRGIYFTAFQLIISHLALIIIFIKFFKEKATIDLLIKFYIGSCMLYIFSTFLLVSVPQLKEFWLSLLYISETDIGHLMKSQYSTRVGIDGFAGFRHTLRFAIGTVLNCYLIIKNLKNEKRTSWFIYIALFFLLMGTLLYGRIGSVVSIIALFVLLLLFLKYQKTISLGIGLIIILLLGGLMLIVIAMLSEPVRIWFTWAFELIITFIQTGQLSSTSTDILFQQMYFIPSLHDFVLGQGWFTDPISGGYFGGTDVGFLRSILFFGIIPTILNYAIPSFILIKIVRLLYKKDKLSSVILGFLMLTLFVVFEVKGGIYHYLIPYILPFYILVHYQNDVDKSQIETL